MEGISTVAIHLRFAAVAALALLGFAVGFAPATWADDQDVAPEPVKIAGVDVSDDADPAAAQACGAFAQVLDGSSYYFGEFADSFEGSTYGDPAVESSGQVGRQAMRESAGTAMNAASTPGLSPDIAAPMRSWSLGATAMWAKMGLRVPGESLNTTANGMNDNATRVQEACAAAGTHA